MTEPERLVAALTAAGWTTVAGRPGRFVRLRWPMGGVDGGTLFVPLDAAMADYADLLGEAIADLEWAAKRGRYAQAALDGFRGAS